MKMKKGKYQKILEIRTSNQLNKGFLDHRSIHGGCTKFLLNSHNTTSRADDCILDSVN